MTSCYLFLQKEDERGVSETLPGHEGLVTCVKFVTEGLFASSDDKGLLVLWKRTGSQASAHYTVHATPVNICILFQWNIVYKVQAHEKSISSLCIFDQWVVTGSSDASVKIWKITFGDGELGKNEPYHR